jgi:energy-coupling factor transporter ATP-binding protein EcfA2
MAHLSAVSTAAPLAPLVTLEHVSYRYPGAADWALRDVTLTLQAGQFVGLLGGVGAGRSTLCRCLNGTIPHHHGGELAGTVRAGGHDSRATPVAILAGMVVVVEQDAGEHLFLSTVEEECLLGPLARRQSPVAAAASARRALAVLASEPLAPAPPRTLSVGQRQRVAIAAALASAPPLLVLDDATSDLDGPAVARLFETCARLTRESGTAILIVASEVELLARHADRLLLLDHGALLADGPPRAVLAQADLLVRAGLRPPLASEVARTLAAAGLGRWPALPLTDDEVVAGLRADRRRP